MSTFLWILLAVAVALVFTYAIWLYRRYRIHVRARFIGFPKPRYDIVSEKDVMVPMQDGTELATDIYRPQSRWKFPVIIMRTPYDKGGSAHLYRQMAELFASLGYVFIVQDVRGKNASEGKFFPYAYEALDGHTTVNWAGEAPWSNGKVALIGFSYLGSCAWLAARYKSHYLRTIVPMFTTQNTYSIWVDRGAPFLKGPLYWLLHFGGKRENDDITHKNLQNILWKLPVNELDVLGLRHKVSFYREYLAHPTPDAFWEELGAHNEVESVDIPALIIGGWYDSFLTGTMEDYQRMTQAQPSSKNHHSRLMVGPWCHDPGQKFEGLDFGKDASFNSILLAILEWCEIWLKEKRPQTLHKSKVGYFVMGQNKWRESEVWPPEGVHEDKLYLTVDKGSWGNRSGALTPVLGVESQESRYIYNPRDPMLFKGGQILDSQVWASPIEQSEIVARDDILIFTSEPFQQDRVVLGSAKVVLYVSSSAYDTDFCAKICDMHPNGKTYNVASGFLRMRFRDSVKHPKLMEPGTVYRVEISLRSVAMAFQKDHRLQLQISSSDFPLRNRNLNTGMSCEFSTEIREAEQTLYTGGLHDSHLILPVHQNIAA